MICNWCLWLLLGISVSMVHLVSKRCGAGVQKGSEKRKSDWLKTVNVCGFFPKAKLQVENLALKNQSCRFGCCIGQSQVTLEMKVLGSALKPAHLEVDISIIDYLNNGSY